MRLAHDHPDDYEARIEQMTDHWDLRDKTLDPPREPTIPACPDCGWHHTPNMKCLPRRP
jgi:hypothetical protein